MTQRDSEKPLSTLRITRDELGIKLAETYALRSTCLRSQVGAIISRDNRPISAGYCGAPAGEPDCFEVGCEIGTHNGCTRTIHAENNAILYAARFGVSVEGCTLYTTLSPCLSCARAIAQVRISRVVFRDTYRDTRGVELLERLGVMVDVEPAS